VNERDEDRVERVDPQGILRHLNFPRQVLIESALEAERNGEDHPAVVEYPQEKAIGSDAEIIEESWLRDNHLLRHDNLRAECAHAEASSRVLPGW